MLRTGLAIALCVFLPACGELGGGEGGESEGAAPGADPQTGAWLYQEGASISDTCMIPGWDVDGTTEFGLTNNGDGSFTVLREGQDIECTVAGDNFSCLPVALDPIMQDGLDATFNLEVTYVGTFSSNTALEGERTIDVTCTGSSCDAAAAAIMSSYPCAVVDSFSASV